MRFWLDLTATPWKEQTVFHGTPSYVEVQTHSLDPRGISYVYVIPVEPGSYVVAACWGHQFDPLVEFMTDPKLGKDWVQAYSETWPTFGELLNNAANARYSAGSLVNFEDLDDGDREWFVATFVGNTIPVETTTELFDEPRVVEATQLVIGRSIQLAEEMQTRQFSGMNKVKMMAKGAFAGYTQGMDMSAVWLSRLQQFMGG
jgi:hypothetical protein